MFTLLSSFCIWTNNLTYISQLTSNNITYCCKSHSEFCPLKTAKAETSWELLYRFYQYFPHYTLCNLYIQIYRCFSFTCLLSNIVHLHERQPQQKISENKEILSTSNLTSDSKPSRRFLIQIKNRNGTIMNPC